MKTSTFLRRLRELAEDEDVAWRLESGALTSDDDLCPIHEVCLARFGRRWEDVFANGAKLGLTVDQVRQIMGAADGVEGHDPALRARLLEACEVRAAS